MTTDRPMDEWKSIPWKKIQRNVFKLPLRKVWIYELFPSRTLTNCPLSHAKNDSVSAQRAVRTLDKGVVLSQKSYESLYFDPEGQLFNSMFKPFRNGV